MRRGLFLSVLLFKSNTLLAFPPMQLYVELTPAGGVLRPEPGHYSGPVVLTRPITIDGQGQVTIDAEGDGSVITIEANNTVLRGLHITNSGDSFDKINSGITLKADQAIIENNHIDNVLFGINVQGSNGNIIRDNKISSKDASPSQRGDGLRMWNSHDNLIEKNIFINVRDLYITNSLTNRFISNEISQSRIGFELVFPPSSLIETLIFSENETAGVNNIMEINSFNIKLSVSGIFLVI